MARTPSAEPYPYKGPVCRGSLRLGTACGHCERCDEEQKRMASAAGLTPEQRAQVIGADTSGIKEIKPGENAGMAVPMQVQSVNDLPKETIKFKIRSEDVNTYEIADGTEIRARLVLMRVDRVLGAYNPDGGPVYLCAWNQVCDVVPGPGTRRREQGS